MFRKIEEGEGYVLDVQAELLSHLGTRVVVPLLPEETAPPAISEPNPLFEIKERRYVMVTQALSAMSNRESKRAIGSLSAQQDAIVRARELLEMTSHLGRKRTVGFGA